MKNKKLFVMMAAILAMGLAACNNSAEESKPAESKPAESSVVAPSSVTPAPSSQTPAPSSQTPAPSSQTPAPSSQTPAPSSQAPASSSEAPAGQMAVNALDVIKESDKVYLSIGGTISGFENADAMKMAFGLLDAIPAQGATAQWLLGSANPADADYSLVPTVDAAAGTFTLKVDVTVVTTIKAGVYTIYVGPKGAYAAVGTQGVTMGTGKEILSGYRWYIRSDKGALAMDELPPLELTISRIETDATHVYHVIGGALNTARLSKEAFLAKHPYVQYEATTDGWKQNVMGSSTKTDLVTVSVDENDNGLIKTDITSLPANGYNIKINLSEDKDADTKMDAIIDTSENPVAFGMYDYVCYADSTQTDKDHIYGNCALFIKTANRYVNNGEKIADLQPVKSKEGEIAYEMVAADCVGQNAPKASDSNSRLGKNSKLTDVWDITGIRSGEYEVYVKAAHSSGNSGSYWSGALNVEHSSNPDNEKTKNGSPYNPAARYNFKIDEGEAVDCICDKTYKDSGLPEAQDDGGWTNVAMAKIMIPEGSTSFTMTNSNNGYALWIYALRIVRVGNWTKPVTPAAFNEGVMRVEAESYHEASADPTIKTEDGATFLDHVGGWPQFNASYKLNFAEAVHVKLKLHYVWYSQMFGKYGAAEFTVDGGAKIKDANGADNLAQADENMTGEWLDTESAEFDLAAGDHTLKFQTPGGCTVSWDYFELIVVAAA